MAFTLRLTPEAEEAIARLDASRLKKVRKTLGRLETNPRHPGLHTHEYQSLSGPNGEKVWEAYVESRTPAAYRVFFCYGPSRGVITIIAVTPHP